MENTTKERIPDAAPKSFAENGYKGTKLRDLAAGLGLIFISTTRARKPYGK